MRIIEPGRSEDFDGFVSRFEELRRDKGMKPGDARAAMLDNNYFATMMLATGQVDALVGGATSWRRAPSARSFRSSRGWKTSPPPRRS